MFEIWLMGSYSYLDSQNKLQARHMSAQAAKKLAHDQQSAWGLI